MHNEICYKCFLYHKVSVKTITGIINTLSKQLYDTVKLRQEYSGPKFLFFKIFFSFDKQNEGWFQQKSYPCYC